LFRRKKLNCFKYKNMSDLKIFTGNNLETLAGKLTAVLSHPPTDALEAEIIVVHSPGMERWVSMELARRLGVCANCSFPFPNSFVQGLFSRVLPGLTEQEKSFFDPRVLTWKIMQLLPGLLERPSFAALRAYLEEERLGLKSLQLAERIARVFDQYQVYRPEMILQWEKGRPGRTGPEQQWQFELWQEITRTRAGIDRTSLREKFFQWVENPGEEIKNLPSRVNVFGISSLPQFYLQIFAALARLIEVNLFLMKPSLKLNSSAAELAGSKGNSLLEYMGTMGREFFALSRELTDKAEELFHDPGESTLLSCLQSDILHNRSRDGVCFTRKAVDSRDHSLQVHVCHSALREIEVLRDSLMAMFDNDPGLCPRDILVMTPQIESYAPYIQAVFDAPEPERIPYSIADRSPRSCSPLVDAFLGMLELDGSRFGARQVLGLLETGEVMRKFSLTAADLELVRQWVEQTRIKWGIDARHRAALGLPGFEENTWRAGLDRLLLGCAMAGGGERMFQGILPYDDLEGAQTGVLGRLLEFVNRLVGQVGELGKPRSLSDWTACLAAMLERFFEPDEETEGELQGIREVLSQLTAKGELAGFSEKVGLEVVKYWLRDRLEEKISASGFITGGVTFCSMVPMRSIGFKVICLVGINDESFPRQGESAGFDLMLSRPREGDPSRRNEDRYLFLEALLAAREKLHISYVGSSDQDNSSIPPSVVVSELLDCLERGFTHPQKKILEHVITRHRLQAFHPDYFRSRSGLFSYSEQNCRACAQALEPRKRGEPFLVSTLPAPPEEWKTVGIRDLCSFFTNPAKFFLNKRLGIYLEEGEKVPGDSEAFNLVQLEKYSLKEELARKGLEGRDPGDFYDCVRAAGRLPHGAVGRYFYELTGDEVEKFIEAVRAYISSEPLDPLEVDLELNGYRITGRLDQIHGQALLRFRPGKVKPKDRLQTWLHHLILNAEQPEGYPLTSVFLGSDKQCRYSPAEDSRKELARLVRYYWEGLSRLWKFFPESSWSFAKAVLEEEKPEPLALYNAHGQWKGSEHNRGEIEDPYLELCFARAEPPLNEEFQQAALEVYRPLIDHREETRL